jgi:hypothetical protein
MPRHERNAGATERAATRRVPALELRIQGKPFRAIGRELGVSHVRAVQYIQQSRAALAAKEQAHAQEQRQLDLACIDKALTGIMPRAEAGNDAAVQSLCRLLERRPRLLGLDALTKAVVSGDLEAPVQVQVNQFSETERAARVELILARARERQDAVPLLTYHPDGALRDSQEQVRDGRAEEVTDES